MMFRRWKSDTGQHIDAFHSVLLSCRTNKPPYISKQRLQRPLVARKNGLFLFRMPGDVSLLYCERSAAPSHGARPPRRGDRLTRLARRPATIDRHDVSGNVRGPSEQRKTTTSATSSGSHQRPSGTTDNIAATASGRDAFSRSVKGVWTSPGATAFTRIPSAASSRPSSMAR